MTKPFYIIICFSFLNLISFGQTKDEGADIKVRGNLVYYVDGVKYIDRLDTAKLAVFYKNSSTLTQGQIKTADSLLFNVVDYYITRIVLGRTRDKDSIILSYGSEGGIDIENYYRQYTVRTFKDGSINIDAFCFCKDMIKSSLINWKKTPIKIHDGGSCVFSVVLDLTKKQARMMRVNGR